MMEGQTSAPTDADILNFALNLEYLEAEFYTVATTGMTIDQMGVGITGTGTQGAATGGSKVNLTNSDFPTANIAMEIASDERAHVNLIRQALTAAGAQPIAQPAINLDALGIGFGGVTDFLQLARAFEDVGVTAYAGAAPLISSKTVLQYAAQILGTEAEHASTFACKSRSLASRPLCWTAWIFCRRHRAELLSVDSNALVQTRTPGQVLNIVYGAVPTRRPADSFPTE